MAREKKIVDNVPFLVSKKGYIVYDHYVVIYNTFW